jgi:LmeA-like phospholipid-binding
VIVVAVVALLAVLLMADRAAVRYAENRIATQMMNRGFPTKPHVSIAGFPFLTQVAIRLLNKVTVSADGRKLGPVEVERLHITAYRVRLNASYHASAASQLSGTALIGFASLARVAGLPGLTVSADGSDRVKITADLGLVSGSAIARVTSAGNGGIRIVVIAAGGIPVAVLGPLGDITLPLPALPLGMTIQDVSVSGQGVLLHLAGQDVSFSG